MLLLIRKTHYLRDFGLSDFMTENAADTLPFSMHLEHYLRCPRPFHRENRLQDVHNELHRREIVI